MVEIILDPSIRDWVVLPMVIIFGCSAMVRHYVTLLLKTEKIAAIDELRPMYVSVLPIYVCMAGLVTCARLYCTE